MINPIIEPTRATQINVMILGQSTNMANPPSSQIGRRIGVGCQVSGRKEQVPGVRCQSSSWLPKRPAAALTADTRHLDKLSSHLAEK